MSNELWIFVCTLTGSVFYIFGIWRGNKDAKRKDEELKRMKDSAEHWEAEAKTFQERFFSKQATELAEFTYLKKRNDVLETENGKLKKQYTDELQKRLELAELVQRHEQAQKDTAEFVTEAIKTVKTEADRGEVSSGD